MEDTSGEEEICIMKICCLSDIHGFLPKIPECDLLILAGDYTPTSGVRKELAWFNKFFAPWLEEQTAKVIGVAGNHDSLFEKAPELVPQMNWTYLQDNGITWNGFNIWGSPWQPRFWDWAFNADEKFMEHKWSLIPEDTDILILHGPPHGYGDFSIYGEEHTGSPSLTKRIEEIKPQLVVAGHIHSGYGIYHIGETIMVNASYVDEQYLAANEPVVLTINKRDKLASVCQFCGSPLIQTDGGSLFICSQGCLI